MTERNYESKIKTANQAILTVDASNPYDVEIIMRYDRRDGLAVYLDRSQVEELVTQLSECLEGRG